MTRRKRRSRKASQPRRAAALRINTSHKLTEPLPHWLDRHEAERERQDERLRKQWACNGEAN